MFVVAKQYFLEYDVMLILDPRGNEECWDIRFLKLLQIDKWSAVSCWVMNYVVVVYNVVCCCCQLLLLSICYRMSSQRPVVPCCTRKIDNTIISQWFHTKTFRHVDPNRSKKLVNFLLKIHFYLKYYFSQKKIKLLIKHKILIIINQAYMRMGSAGARAAVIKRNKMTTKQREDAELKKYGLVANRDNSKLMKYRKDQM